MALWEASRWRLERDSHLASPWGINPDLTVEPPELWSYYLTWYFPLFFKLVESRFSITGNKSILKKPPTFNEPMYVPGIVLMALCVLLHSILTEPHDRYTIVIPCWKTRDNSLGRFRNMPNLQNLGGTGLCLNTDWLTGRTPV